MKFSLRKSILAIAALALAGVAVAQAPALTKVWEQKIGATPARDHSRFATGFDGNLYVIDKENAKILKFNAEGVSDFAELEGIGTAITSDDAGNIIVNKDFPNAGSFTTWVIIEPNGTQHELTITPPEGVEAARLDQIGRVVGDVLSEDGGYMYLAGNGHTTVTVVKVANGEQESAESSLTVANSMNTSTLCQPMLASVEDIEAAADPTATFYARNRSDNKVYAWSEDGTEQAVAGTVGAGGNDGFDAFILGDKLYAVASSERASDKFMVKDLAGDEIIAEAGGDNAPSNAYFFRAYTARKIDDNTYGIYAWCPGNGGSAAYYTFGGGEAPAKLYVLGQVNGKDWAPNDGVEMTLAEGVFSADITISAAAGYFAFVTDLAENNDEGGWAYVNERRYGAANDGDVASTEVENALVKGEAAYQLPAGEYTFSVNEDLNTLIVTKKDTPVVYPDELYILGEVDDNSWAPNVGLMMTPADANSLTGEFIASFKADGRNDGYNYFSFTSKLAESADDWAGIGPYRYGADASDKEVVLDEAMAIQAGANAFKIAAGEYNVEVNLAEGTVKFSAVPVVGPTAPVISPDGGEYEESVTVTITSESADEIRYTLDGSEPNAESALYSEPIVLNEVGSTITVKAIAIKNGLISDAVEATYTIKSSGGGGGEATIETILESKENIIASGDGRFSTGYGDYLYINDKANGKVVRYDKTGARSDFAEVEGIGTGITSDDAGNILVNKGFPGAGSATDWVIIEPDGTQHAVAIEFPAAVAAARNDAAGRVVGDVMSEDGGYLFLAVNTADKVVCVKIANGEFVEAIESPTAQYAFDSTSIAQPRYTSVEETEAAADPSTAVVYRKRGNLNIYGWNEDGSEIVDFGRIEGARSCEGFDIFTIGDKTYSVEPSTDTNYASGFAIRELGGDEVLVSVGNTIFAGGSQRFQSFTARVFADRDEEPYAMIYRHVSGEGVSFYKFTPAPTGVESVAAEGNVVATTYYNLQGVRVNNPAAGQILIKVNTLSNGKISASKVMVR